MYPRLQLCNAAACADVGPGHGEGGRVVAIKGADTLLRRRGRDNFRSGFLMDVRCVSHDSEDEILPGSEAEVEHVEWIQFHARAGDVVNTYAKLLTIGVLVRGDPTYFRNHSVTGLRKSKLVLASPVHGKLLRWNIKKAPSYTVDTDSTTWEELQDPDFTWLVMQTEGHGTGTTP
jgi:hypothetical protein